MQIIKKEILNFNEEETKAFQLVTKMCLEIERETNDLELAELATIVLGKVSELWGYNENE